MNKKSLIKVLSILFLVVAILFTFVVPCFAKEPGKAGYDVKFSANDTTNASKSIVSVVSALLNMVQIIGVGVATIMLIVLAIKYMSAAPNDKAEIKKHMVVYVVGAIVLFAAAGIIEIIKQFSGNIKGSEN